MYAHFWTFQLNSLPIKVDLRLSLLCVSCIWLAQRFLFQVPFYPMDGVLKCHGFEIQFMASNENNDCKEISLHVSGSQVIA